MRGFRAQGGVDLTPNEIRLRKVLLSFFTILLLYYVGLQMQLIRK